MFILLPAWIQKSLKLYVPCVFLFLIRFHELKGEKENLIEYGFFILVILIVEPIVLVWVFRSPAMALVCALANFLT